MTATARGSRARSSGPSSTRFARASPRPPPAQPGPRGSRPVRPGQRPRRPWSSRQPPIGSRVLTPRAFIPQRCPSVYMNILVNASNSRFLEPMPVYGLKSITTYTPTTYTGGSFAPPAATNIDTSYPMFRWIKCLDQFWRTDCILRAYGMQVGRCRGMVHSRSETRSHHPFATHT